MTAIRIVHGCRITEFDDALRPTRVFDDFGKGGTTEFRPPEVWASPEAVREAEEQAAEASMVDVTAQRRRRAKERG